MASSSASSAARRRSCPAMMVTDAVTSGFGLPPLGAYPAAALSAEAGTPRTPPALCGRARPPGARPPRAPSLSASEARLGPRTGAPMAPRLCAIGPAERGRVVAAAGWEPCSRCRLPVCGETVPVDMVPSERGSERVREWERAYRSWASTPGWARGIPAVIEQVISPSSGEAAASPGRVRGSVMVAMSCDMAARSMAALASSLGCVPGERSRNSQSGARMSSCDSTAASSSWHSAASSTASAPPCMPSLASRLHRSMSKERTGLPKSDTSRRTPCATASASRAASRTEMRLTRTAMAPPLKSLEPEEKREWRSSTAAASLRERK
eukprot:scaffold9063_cov52-Phaeocystis_antarctica.AAC.4